MKFPLWATILTLAGLIILCSLGTWQLQRLQWKSALLQEIDSEYAKDPMDFELTYENLTRLEPQPTFVRGFAEGVYRHQDEIAVGPRTYEGQSGYHLITPFETLDNRIILVNRGWVPPAYNKEKNITRPDLPIIIKGTARKAQPSGLFTPQNVPELDQWYHITPEEISVAKNLQSVSAYILYAEEGYESPISTATRWQPPNNHLHYALFWFTMAGVLLLIYYLRFIRKTS